MTGNLFRRLGGLLRKRDDSRVSEWESKHWRLPPMPPELLPALHKAGLAAGGRILDIGSGMGDISAWLVESGYRVLGIDKEAAAITVAKRDHPENANLEHRQFDFLNDDLDELGRFDAAVDRGCLHQMDKSVRPDYLASLESTLKPGAVFCLFHRFEEKDLERGITPDYVRSLFEPHFELVEEQPHRFPSQKPWIRRRGRFLVMRRKRT